MTTFMIGEGSFTAAVQDARWLPHHRVARPPVVYCQGLYAPMDQTAITAIANTLRAILSYGFSIVVPNLLGYWGNATGNSRIIDALAYARANLGATNAPAIIVGASHGAGSAMRFTAQQPAMVSAVVGIIPALDYQQLRVNDPLGLGIRSSIDAAFGVTYPAALPALTSPMTRTAELSAKPIQLWTASDDPVSVNHATFSAAVGAETHNLGALGHSDAAMAAVDHAAVAAFVNDHA